MQFTNIQAIRDHQFVGNHHSDSDAFRAIDAFARSNANTIADRAEALRIIGRSGMGLTDAEMQIVGKTDAEQVAAFLASL